MSDPIERAFTVWQQEPIQVTPDNVPIRMRRKGIHEIIAREAFRSGWKAAMKVRGSSRGRVSDKSEKIQVPDGDGYFEEPTEEEPS